MEATFLELLAKVREEARILKETTSKMAFDAQIDAMKASGATAAMQAEFKRLREKNLSMDVLGKLVTEFKEVQTELQAALAHKQSLPSASAPAAGGRRRKTRRRRFTRKTRARRR
jgi:hypothetical protein